MILFAEDWLRYPSAIPDFKTINQSFVQLAAKLKVMGVQNHLFFLALHDQRLQGVDPFDPNLTHEQIAAIALECEENPWYFFREVARVPPQSGEDLRPIEANRGNICLFWCFFNHITIILIQIRQTGKSFSTDILMSYLLNIACQDTTINLLTKDDTLRRANVKRLKEICGQLPPYLNQRSKADVNNGEQITIKSRNNTYTTHVPQNDEKRAYTAARGLTSPIFHIDEPPFQPYIKTSLPAALGAMGAAVDAAKRSGSHYGVILTTTAGKKDDRDGSFIFQMVQESAEWTEAFYDAKNWLELYKIVCARSSGGSDDPDRPKDLFQVNATFSHLQLGKTDAWLREVIQRSKATGDDANRDFFNMWTSGSQTNPLPTEVLGKISKSKRDPLWSEIHDPYGYITDWFIPRDQIASRLARGKFIMAIDPSEAINRDDTSMVMIDVETLETIATGCYNEISMYTFTQFLADFIVKYENVTVIIERRSQGALMFDILLEKLPVRGVDPFKRLFNRVVQESDEYRERWNEVKFGMGRRNSEVYIRYKQTFGFATAGSGAMSRTDLYSRILRLAADRSCNDVRSSKLVTQILGLINNKGRIDHAPGEHDDMVVAWLLCHWLLTDGKNLDFYGIDTSRIMSRMRKDTTVTPEQMWKQIEQLEIRRAIDALYEKMVAEKDEFILQRYEQELRVLDSRLVLEETDTYSMSQMLNAIREERAKKRFTRRNDTSFYGTSSNEPAYYDRRSSERVWAA